MRKLHSVLILGIKLPGSNIFSYAYTKFVSLNIKKLNAVWFEFERAAKNSYSIDSPWEMLDSDDLESYPLFRVRFVILGREILIETLSLKD